MNEKMAIRLGALALLLVGPGVPDRLDAQDPAFGPEHVEVVLHLLPAAARADARVLVRSGDDFEVVHEGSNEWTCWVERFGDRMGGNCHHTVLDRFLRRKRELSATPVEGETPDQTLAREYRMGLLSVPEGAMETNGYGPITSGGGPPDVLIGRFFLYFPFQTPARFGAPGTEPYPGGPWLHQGGTVQAHLMWSREVRVGAEPGATRAGPAPVGPDARDVVLRNVDVLTMKATEVLEKRDVVIRGERILAIRPTAPGFDGDSATVVDGTGLTVMPGLADMHVHVRSEWALPLYLAHGVTTIRSMNGAFGDPLAWRREIEEGARAGPSMVVASPTIRFDRGEEYDFRAPDVASARRLVRSAADRGYDLIKVYQVPDSVLPALVATADSVGLPVAGHVPFFAPGEATLDTSRRALQSVLATGMGIEHLGGLVHAWLREDTTSTAIDALAATVVAADLPVTPIVSTDLAYARIVLHGEDAWSEAERARIGRLAGRPGIEQLRSQVEGLHGGEPWATEQTRSLLRSLYEAGVTLLAGTDSHQASALAGVSLIDELDAMRAVGMPAIDVLKTATVNPAQVLGRSEDHGTVEPGKVADLLVLRGNPLEDWTALRRVAGVVRAGSWLAPSRLDSLVAEAIRHGTLCSTDRCDG